MTAYILNSMWGYIKGLIYLVFDNV